MKTILAAYLMLCIKVFLYVNGPVNFPSIGSTTDLFLTVPVFMR